MWPFVSFFLIAPNIDKMLSSLGPQWHSTVSAWRRKKTNTGNCGQQT